MHMHIATSQWAYSNFEFRSWLADWLVGPVRSSNTYVVTNGNSGERMQVPTMHRCIVCTSQRFGADHHSLLRSSCVASIWSFLASAALCSSSQPTKPIDGKKGCLAQYPDIVLMILARFTFQLESRHNWCAQSWIVIGKRLATVVDLRVALIAKPSQA